MPEHNPGDWHWWFAWRPIRADCGRLTWLRQVWRRKRYYHPPTGADFWSFDHHIPRGWVAG